MVPESPPTLEIELEIIELRVGIIEREDTGKEEEEGIDQAFISLEDLND